MAVRHVYLRIEEIVGYSPVEPTLHTGTYRRDCMRNTGHEDATIPLSEVNARSLTALVYREYLDPDYLVPKPDKIVQADVNEPIYTHRVPGTVIYARSGDRLHIHVFNADGMPHSFHVHGLEYGIDSDGSWPLGVQTSDGRRSDEICPGQSWTYRFDVLDDMVGAWPFHDHSRHIGESVNRGLFGGIVVLPRDCDEPHHFHLPPLVSKFVERCCREHPDDDPKPTHGHDDEHGHDGDHEPGEHGHGAGHPEHEHGAGGQGPGGGHGHGGGHGPGRGIGPNIRDFEHRGVLNFLEEWAQLEYAHPRPSPTRSCTWERSSSGEKGTSVLLPLRPPAYTPRVLIAGGDYAPAQKTAEWIDLSLAAPAWQALPGTSTKPDRIRSIRCSCRTGA